MRLKPDSCSVWFSQTCALERGWGLKVSAGGALERGWGLKVSAGGAFERVAHGLGRGRVVGKVKKKFGARF